MSEVLVTTASAPSHPAPSPGVPSLPIHVACRRAANHKAAFTKQLLMEIQGGRQEEGAGMGPRPHHPLQPSLDGDLRPSPAHTSQLSGRKAGCQ